MIFPGFINLTRVTYACTISNKKYVINDALDKIQNEVSSVNIEQIDSSLLVKTQ